MEGYCIIIKFWYEKFISWIVVIAQSCWKGMNVAEAEIIPFGITVNEINWKNCLSHSRGNDWALSDSNFEFHQVYVHFSEVLLTKYDYSDQNPHQFQNQQHYQK